MASNSKMEIEKFNGKIFELCGRYFGGERSVDRGRSRYDTYRNFCR
jgi:hypothetical protein